MDCIANINKLALDKFSEAECLFNNEHYDGAYYMAGYTIELLLKAKICKNLGIEDFFDEKNGIIKKIKFPQTFKSHDYEQLLVLSGVYKELDIAFADVNFKVKWSSVCAWSEESRYSTGKTPEDVQDFLTSIKEIVEWIQKHL
jgi:HEPN domain-containing protein